jgi:molecular chaperone HtpG
VLTTLDDYIKECDEKQKKIYFVCASNYQNAINSPFLDVFKDAGVPVLVLSNQMDEMVFK